MHRTLDVLDLAVAAVDEVDSDAAAQILLNAVRYRHSTRPGKPLDAGRHVHAVAIEIAAIHHDVAEVDADAQDDALVRRQVAIGGDHGPLEFRRTLDGADGARELDQDAVAHALEDAAAMALDERLEHLLPARLQPRQRACLVPLHKPAVANHVGRQDRGEPALDVLVGHLCGYLP